MLQRQPACFVPNLGQWEHRVKFVHRSGPMTLFLEDRGWVLDLVEHPAKPKTRPHQPVSPDTHQGIPADGPDDHWVDQKTRGVALKMTFEGDGAHVPEIVGEKKLAGRHNYFLGNDESRWRTEVPLYGSILYEGLYPGIDLRLREMNGVPEYDLLLQPGADLLAVCVHVEGAGRLSIAGDGSLVIETAVGPLTQPVPKTWQVDRNGEKSEVACNFTLIDENRFGFTAPGWNGEMSLTIDPGLIWSTFLGGTGYDSARKVSVDQRGIVTVAGRTTSIDFPTTSGAYDTTHNGPTTNGADVFVSRLDPSKTGAAQLIYSTFVGGNAFEGCLAMSVDNNGVITVGGETRSSNFPTTSGAYDTTFSGASDGFVFRLDPGKSGAAQLVYSTLIGGGKNDGIWGVHVAGNVLTFGGLTDSTKLATSTGAFDGTHNGGFDGFVGRLDLSKSSSAQLTYQTYLGGSRQDVIRAMGVDANGVVTVAGETISSNFVTTSGAYDRSLSGTDGFVSQLDPSKTGSGQLVYSTFLGGSNAEFLWGLTLEQGGVVTVTGESRSDDFFGTSGAYATKRDSTVFNTTDAIVCRLDPSKTGAAQLLYATFLGGPGFDRGFLVHVDSSGILTVAGECGYSGFPTTPGAFDTTHNGGFDCFVSRLDPKKTGSAQLRYSTFLGGDKEDSCDGMAVDRSGTVTLAGKTAVSLPTTVGAYSTKHRGGSSDAFVSRLCMGVALYGDVHEVSISAGGTQKLTVNAGKAHATRSYWIFGSLTGTTPGVTLYSAVGAVTIPLVPDLYTNITIANPNSQYLVKTKGTLNAAGTAVASFIVPPLKNTGAIGLVFHHAYLVYDASNNFYMASNPVPLKLVK